MTSPSIYIQPLLLSDPLPTPTYVAPPALPVIAVSPSTYVSTIPEALDLAQIAAQPLQASLSPSTPLPTPVVLTYLNGVLQSIVGGN